MDRVKAKFGEEKWSAMSGKQRSWRCWLSLTPTRRSAGRGQIGRARWVWPTTCACRCSRCWRYRASQPQDIGGRLRRKYVKRVARRDRRYGRLARVRGRGKLDDRQLLASATPGRHRRRARRRSNRSANTSRPSGLLSAVTPGCSQRQPAPPVNCCACTSPTSSRARWRVRTPAHADDAFRRL